MYRKLLVPLDGSELAERALPYAGALAAAAGGTLVLVRAAMAPVPGWLDGATRARDISDRVEEAERYLAQVAAKLRSRVGRTGVSRARFGSVTGAVLRDGNTPVMVVHPRPSPPSTAVHVPTDLRLAISV
jgi:nucleotide-binding universal stress UspA family protein